MAHITIGVDRSGQPVPFTGGSITAVWPGMNEGRRAESLLADLPDAGPSALLSNAS